MSTNTDVVVTMGTTFRGAMDIMKMALPRKEKQSILALSILIRVEKNPGISQGELGRILRRDPMTMSQAVRALQSSNLIISQPDAADRRVKRLTVTKKGKGMGEVLMASESKLLGQLAREWGKGKVNQLKSLVNEFDEFLNAKKV